MPRYDFKSLSSQDFEELIRDLLQTEWNVALEAFRTGRDGGIDLRYAQADGGATVIQCKHYAASGFAKLLAHLRDGERPKIARLGPTRYVVATSVSLTPGNKDGIVEALRPFVLGVRDVLGADDIEGLLSRHPGVERANFKLWLTSTSVLDRVLHNAAVCQTDFEVERLRRKLPVFVKNDAYPRATEILDQTRIVVVSGTPGIGKTTLAEMLLYAHLEDGYEPIVIKAEIAEAKQLFKPALKQVFYYDDFLGQTFLGDRREYLGRNQDAAMVDFMEMVRQSPHSRFILTTREHILSGALQVSERLAHSPMLEHRCILELGDYSYGHRARILYNHLYFSDLPQEYKDEVLKDDFFLDIIMHQHFTPRLVEWLSAHTRLRQVPVQGYRAHISALLESPETIWAHAFRQQISDAARHALLCLYTLGAWTDVIDLEPAFIALHRHSAAKYNHRIAAGDFRAALQELDGAFLTYSSGHAGYLNPSVGEFVASVIFKEREMVEDLLISAARFKQVANLWKLAAARPAGDLRTVLMANTDLLCRSLSRLLHGPALRWERMRDGTRTGYPIDMDYEAKVGFLAEVAAAHESTQLAAMAGQAADTLLAGWDRQVVDFGPVLRLLAAIAENTWYLANGGRDVYRKLLNGLLDGLESARANDWLDLLAFPEKALEWSEADETRLSAGLRQYEQRGIDDERDECTSLDEVTGLRESLDTLSKKYSLDFDYVIDRLDEDIAEREARPLDLEEGSGFSRNRMTVPHQVVTDDEVREMFRTLRDSA